MQFREAAVALEVKSCNHSYLATNISLCASSIETLKAQAEKQAVMLLSQKQVENAAARDWEELNNLTQQLLNMLTSQPRLSNNVVFVKRL